LKNHLSFKNSVPIFVQIGVQMLTTTISDFRKDIKRYFDRVSKNFETLIINRGKDNGIVVMSLDEYNALMATQHELSSKKNEQRLDSAIEKLKKGKSFAKGLIEP
jgi:antitoxin YefM